MAELRPFPIAALLRRAFFDLERHDGIYDLPRRKFFTSPGELDLSVRLHGKRAATPLGPAAGPQTQMAQNILLSYLAGCRIMELKTVQINDRLEIPRPCIDMMTIGFNVEWSQELRLEESLEEYVKGAMLIRILNESGLLGIPTSFQDVVFDMSVGYDLAGIQSERVQRFIDGMLDCTALVDKLRKQIPDELKQYRDLDFQTRLSDTLTLSTFHGCPPDEIERIVEFLLEDKELHCIVKLNPTLLGKNEARALLRDQLGYQHIQIPDAAFDKDTHWDQAQAFVERLGAIAERDGLGFGVKFSNTLLVENFRDFFPDSEKVMYLSGPPLHVFAMSLVQKFRARFGDRYPISFSAGIDRGNFADAAALGLVPITACSDLLKPGGYSRASGYLEELQSRMIKVGARNMDEYLLRAYGLGAGSLAEARLANTEHYVQKCLHDSRYAYAKNQKPPRKIGSSLALFDCVSCNKCVPVCPNDANFALAIPEQEQPILKARKTASGWTTRSDGMLTIAAKSQYANFADFCNECGNCDIFCPEDGGPYLVKPRFFGSLADWKTLDRYDGFFVESSSSAVTMHGRIDGKSFVLVDDGAETQRFSGEGFDVRLCASDPTQSLRGEAAEHTEVDLTYFFIMSWLKSAVFDDGSSNYLKHL